MIYKVLTTSEADDDFARLAKSEPKAYKKAVAFIDELRIHPRMVIVLILTAYGHYEDK